MITIFNETKPLNDWMIDKRAAVGIYPKLYRIRIKQGWSYEKALIQAVKNPPNGLGLYLYGYPFKMCGEIAPNYWQIPPEPDRHTYFLSDDRLTNIHFRAGKFNLVNNGKIIAKANTFKDCEDMYTALFTYFGDDNGILRH